MGEEIAELKRALDDAAAKGASDAILAALAAVDARAGDVRLEDLRQTRIGASVGRLRAHSDAAVARAAKAIVARWKPLTQQQSQSQQSQQQSTPQPKRRDPTPEPPPSPKRRKTPEPPIQQTTAQSGESAREKCAAMIAEALGPAKAGDRWAPDAAAALIEARLFEMHGGVSKAYKTQFRTIFLNLKNADGELRDAVMGGDDSGLPPSRVCSMSSEAMAPEAVRRARDRAQAAAMREAQGAKVADLVQDGMFECRKCKSKRTTTHEMQTRSADEPMTVFITCANCGNRWRL